VFSCDLGTKFYLKKLESLAGLPDDENRLLVYTQYQRVDDVTDVQTDRRTRRS